MLVLIFILAFLSTSLSDKCVVSQKSDCGYVGINQQQCEAKGCCWRPTSSQNQDQVGDSTDFLPIQGDPWCYYASASNCDQIKLTASNPGFTPEIRNAMYINFEKNLNISGKGGVAAAVDNDMGYFQHWVRDAAISMRIFMHVNEHVLHKIRPFMESYVQFVLKIQAQKDPNGQDIRTEPKFNLPEGDCFTGGWCRPQTDGPALTAATLIIYANTLLDEGEADYVKKYLWTSDGSYNGGAIRYDLAWVVSNWRDNSCDLWEEVQSIDFFWNRMAFAFALSNAKDFAVRMGDFQAATQYQNTYDAIKSEIPKHWNGQFIYESTNRQKDGSVTDAIARFDGMFDPTDEKVASTIRVLNNQFCNQFYINQKDNAAGIPGVLYGRYEGDTYQGGNPWQLLSAAVAELFYQGAQIILKKDTIDSVSPVWYEMLELQNPTRLQLAKAQIAAGDAIMTRIYEHVKNDKGVIYEQIDKNEGYQRSAKGLTWSYTCILCSLHERDAAMNMLAQQLQ